MNLIPFNDLFQKANKVHTLNIPVWHQLDAEHFICQRSAKSGHLDIVALLSNADGFV
jgi:hypothetical protein